MMWPNFSYSFLRISNSILLKNFFFILHSPYAYQFGLGKRADSDDFSNYEDDGDNYNNANYDKANINLEDWNDGGYMDNKNDIDVLDYGYNYGYPRGKLFVPESTF